jgi:CheY-like chemotaxis protein
MADAPSSPPRRVLVVDGHADFRDSMVALLEMQGFDVCAAPDGPDAIEQALRFRPDVVLLDLGLPSMTGHEVARTLRKLPTTADVFIAAVTGYGTLADREQAAAAGIDLHLVKPVGLDELLPALRATRAKG